MIDNCLAGDKVVMKKNHACGKNEWLIISEGNTIKMQCVACGRTVEMSRDDFFKHARKKINENA